MAKRKPAKYERNLITLYFPNRNMTNPKLATSRGYPKAQVGSARGAGKVIMAGFASKVQCINRHTREVIWTAERVKVPGLGQVYAVKVTAGRKGGDTWP